MGLSGFVCVCGMYEFTLRAVYVRSFCKGVKSDTILSTKQHFNSSSATVMSLLVCLRVCASTLLHIVYVQEMLQLFPVPQINGNTNKRLIRFDQTVFEKTGSH